MTYQTKRRVVITGLGAVAANGIGKKAFWDATSKGVSGIKPFKRFSADSLPLRVGGEISDFLPNDYMERKLVNRTDRMTHFVFASIQEALRDAGMTLAEENPQSAIAWLQVANVGQASIRYGFQGYCKAPLNDTAGGLDSLSTAYQAILRGTADVIITGGCEAPLHPFPFLILAHTAPCVKGDDPKAYRPFDRRAAGLILAEGAGVCILEDYEHARRRGASIYGEIVGYGQTTDANGIAPPSCNGKQYARAICLAMQEAGLRTEDIGYFSLDGQAIPPSDRGEADALLIPPTINCEELNPDYGLNLVRDEARPLSQPAVLLGARGAGGANVVVAIKKGG